MDFKKGLIYKLTCLDPNIKEIYIGSTTSFKDRKHKHSSVCNNNSIYNKGYNRKVYKYIRDNGGWGNWDMILIKYFPCDTRLELRKEEDKVKKELGATLNMINAIEDLQSKKKNDKEYRVKNKEKINNRTKEWAEKNKSHILDYRKEYSKRTKTRESKKEWDIKNRDKISLKKKEKFPCVCGSVIRKDSKYKHEKTKKHLAFLETCK